jgi:hypothetical protein
MPFIREKGGKTFIREIPPGDPQTLCTTTTLCANRETPKSNNARNLFIFLPI